MAAKLFSIVVVTLFLAGCTAAYGVPMYNRRFSSQLPRLFQAACLVKNATTGEELQNEDCNCGDETVACDIGPITHYGMEMTFCNKLEDQSEDQLYVLQFACISGEDANCGTGTFCDIGPLTYEDTEYYICRFASSVSADAESMCKPDVTFTQPPAWGQGAQFGGRRWAAAAGQSNVPNSPQQWGPGMGWRWNPGMAPQGANGPVNPQQNAWGPGMGWRWNQGTAPQGANGPVDPSQNAWGPGMGGGRGWNQPNPAGGTQTWNAGGRRRGGGRRGGRFN